MEEKEKEFQKSLMMLEVYRNQIDTLSRQIEIVGASLEEHLRAKETLTQYKKIEKGKELLVPIGATIFLFVNAKESAKVLMGIGSSILVDKGIDEAIEMVEERIKELKETEKKIAEELRKVQGQATALSQRTQTLYSELEGKG